MFQITELELHHVAHAS